VLTAPFLFDKHLSICVTFWANAAERGGNEGTYMAGQFVSDVTDAEFQEKVLQSETPVLVDFWAAWCGPCRALAPVVDAVAEQYKGKLKVMKMDVDRNNMTPGRYGIRGIPALLLFKEGKVAEQIVGFVPKEHIEQALGKHVAATAVA
jgi:thioredoxin 1